VVVGGEYALGVGRGEDWGEKYPTTSRLNLFLVHTTTGQIGCIANVPSSTNTTTEGGYVLGQLVLSPNGKYAVYVAWDAGGGGTMPR
jgi:hypothetical protein